MANLERFDALFKCLMPPWLEVRSCCIFDLTHADKMGTVSLQVCFLEVHEAYEWGWWQEQLHDRAMMTENHACSCLKKADSLAVAIAFNMFDILSNTSQNTFRVTQTSSKFQQLQHG